MIVLCRRILRNLFILGTFAFAAHQAIASTDAQNLVMRADSFRQIYFEAVMNVRLTKYIGNERERESILKVAIQGSEKSLIHVIEGADRGQQMLMTNEGLWVKLPRSTRAVRITPMQRLLGEASIGDVGRMRWQDDYIANFADETEKKGIAKLELIAKSDLALYPKIWLTVSLPDGIPIEATFFLKSGKPLKKVAFNKPEKINDRIGIKKMIFTDLLRPDNKTEMVLEQTFPKSIPSRLYAVESLGEWQ